MLRKKPYRCRWSDAARDEALVRLLELNAQQTREERLRSLKADTDRHGSGRMPADYFSSIRANPWHPCRSVFYESAHGGRIGGTDWGDDAVWTAFNDQDRRRIAQLAAAHASTIADCRARIGASGGRFLRQSRGRCCVELFANSVGRRRFRGLDVARQSESPPEAPAPSLICWNASARQGERFHRRRRGRCYCRRVRPRRCALSCGAARIRYRRSAETGRVRQFARCARSVAVTCTERADGAV